MTNTKMLITEYIEALSGKPKPAGLVARYVADTGLAEHIAQVEAAFPCYEIRVEDLLAEDDKVLLRGTFRGVHQGPFARISATGHGVSAGLMIVYRVADGRIVEHWMQFDSASLLQQLQAASAGAAPMR